MTDTASGYDRFRIERLHVKATLPAGVWRIVSVAERPGPYCDIRPVIVDDHGTPAVVLSAGHYEALVYRLRELEGWLAEYDTEGEGTV